MSSRIYETLILTTENITFALEKWIQRATLKVLGYCKKPYKSEGFALSWSIVPRGKGLGPPRDDLIAFWDA